MVKSEMKNMFDYLHNNIQRINDSKIFSVDDVNDIILNKTSGEVLRIEMLNLNGELERYIFR